MSGMDFVEEEIRGDPKMVWHPLFMVENPGYILNSISAMEEDIHG